MNIIFTKKWKEQRLLEKVRADAQEKQRIDELKYKIKIETDDVAKALRDAGLNVILRTTLNQEEELCYFYAVLADKEIIKVQVNKNGGHRIDKI